MKKISCPLAIVGLFIVGTLNVQASAVIINTTYDLNNGFGGITPLDNGQVTIASNDHVELNVTFTSGRMLTIGDGAEWFSGWLASTDNNSSFTIDNASIEFTGFSGTGGASSLYNLGSVSSGVAHIGPYLSDFLSFGQSVSFTGYKVTYDVLSIAQDPHDYGSLWFIAEGDNRSISPIPEPETYAMLLAGLGLLGFMARRRKESVV